jgi:hypothetical protein
MAIFAQDGTGSSVKEPDFIGNGEFVKISSTPHEVPYFEKFARSPCAIPICLGVCLLGNKQLIRVVAGQASTEP